MKMRGAKGFTLVELLVAISLGLLVTGAAVAVYKQAVDSTTYLTQRTVVQGNARAAMNTISQDLNFAGYGLPIGGIPVPTAALFSCATGSAAASWAYSCPTTAPSFPVISGAATMSGITPMYQAGPTINGNATDQMAMAYVDSSPNFSNNTCGVSTQCGFDAFPLTQASVSGSTTTLYFNGSTTPAPNDTKWGLKVGDILLVSNSTGQAVGEVTSVTSGNVVLAASDPMKLNQAFGTGGSVPNVLGFSSGIQAYNNGAGPLQSTNVKRLYIVTYYVATDPLAQAVGTTGNPTRLYRMVNGDSNTNPPVPVAEQISNLTFSYNMFDSVCGGSQSANQRNPTTNQIGLIKTINASIFAASTLNTTAIPGQAIQQIPMTTTVSPRNLSYFDSYSSTPQGSC
ncbi:hypothetical protein Acid345_2002 [Candidatus Koribacter versatilis Ellin345]|uniref:Prepilin-type N-terminal cleavage/methylation domain-containing protein n=1 Tax=Koribacter versatilis (strain Ellin345) TaxID=204669 RepID=Q1IQ47_KORVE|nr:prepilin-type N-terminal cleavage/methylation domain-containing protein [Candidatus Koribacter versatilis]ABF41003.1 hypothetical protein Acid345_2002 [Candidatus Koribacter versatilis Ellin345]